ncbi:hypothetical protein ACMU_04025 [Actibacterium mucosum KCTC 23349]|uniref:Transcriptional regulator n=1 Tax=Actibacterium mucosum KCTC 23349 TaxID=1454373 RepID=A0A037ZEW8_9RHOB|nr:MurR/RpiR family transcriptional regulator [Actibacterium mucosum]KAJ54071.1 hypothetical protein ACMU_04025 [Actibacterium mucosum KCTC 23349]
MKFLSGSYEQRLSKKYEVLSEKLRQAGDYVAANPLEVATRSLRAVATESGLAPATYSRLARALEYDSFEDLREVMRRKISRREDSFATRAERLRHDHRAGNAGFFEAHLAACQNNLRDLARDIDQNALEQAVDALLKARKVLLFGALGSTGVVEYLSYMADFCQPNWTLAGRAGASLGSALTALQPGDGILIVTKPPFAPKSINAARLAREKGAYVVVITDTHACPALRYASAGFIVPTNSPHFYSSYVGTMFLMEAMIGILVGRLGPDGSDRIAAVEQSHRQLNEVWDG